jgi:hypothetical protein
MAVVFFAPAVLLADERLTLTSITSAGVERRVGADTLAQGPGALVAAVAGVDTLPVGCATPLVAGLAARRESLPAPLRAALGSLETPPAIEDERSLPARDGRSLIHFSASARLFGVRPADRDGDGVPDPIDRIGEALVAARSILAARYGLQTQGTETAPLDVYVVALGHGLEGYSVPARSTSEGGPAPVFIVLDAGLAADRIMPAVVHQVAHASARGTAWRAAGWWSEAAAGALTLQITGDLQGPGPALRVRARDAGRALETDDLLLMEGDLLWPEFLIERTGDPGVFRLVGEEMTARGGPPLVATDQVLARRYGLTLDQAFREYLVWNLLTGSRDDGRHYTLGGALPETPLTTLGPELPIDADPVEPVEGRGSVALRLLGSGVKGALELEIRAEGGRPGADLLVFARGLGGPPALVPVDLSSGGSGRVSLPWGDVAEIWIVLRNDAEEGSPARFAVRGAHDPFAPYDLASLQADPVGTAITLSWTTASEKGLVGWNVYRSETPSGPFARLNGLAVPAYGDASTETGYLFLDDTARPGRRYYYQVEGITGLGLAERSQVVSGRIPVTR